jgi:ribosomal protein S18 acetylase RimI-like enzyme
MRTLSGGLELDDDRGRLDLDAVHRFLSEESYWGRGRARDVQERLVGQSALVVGLYDGERQIGFARAVDCAGAGFVYLADVYVLSEYRDRGLGVELVREIVENGPFTERRWILHTDDAHGLYERFGFGMSGRLLERPAR